MQIHTLHKKQNPSGGPFRDSHTPDGIDDLRPFRMGDRMDFHFKRFGQKALCSEQNAESFRPDMTFQVFTVLPLLEQMENRFAVHITENLIPQAPFLLSCRFNHREKCQHDLFLLLRKYIHCDPDDDHKSTLLSTL